MPGDARLRLAENGDSLADGELGLGQKPEQPQPRLLAGRIQRGEGGLQREKTRRRGHGVSEADIKISIYVAAHGIKRGRNPSPAGREKVARRSRVG
ncbi:hypothetical protein Ms3S1_37650 [Methylosinus sp. 3S-1]